MRRVYTFERVHMSNVDKSSRSVFYFNYDFSNYSVSNHPIILKADKNRYRHQIFLKSIALLGFPIFVLRILTSVHHKPHIYRYLNKRAQLYLFYRNFIAVFPNHCSLIHFLCCTKVAKEQFRIKYQYFYKIECCCT